MPAVTVADTLVLPRVTAPAEGRDRAVVSLTTAPRGFEGEGFPVYRAFAGVDMRVLDPFIHQDAHYLAESVIPRVPAAQFEYRVCLDVRL